MESYRDSVEVTLGEASPEVLALVWSGKFEPNQWWWCKHCEKVFPASAIWFYDGQTYCAYCEAPGSYLYWYHGWPSLVLDGWTFRPEQGKRYPLPCDWLEIEVEEPGCAAPDRAGLPDVGSGPPKGGEVGEAAGGG